MNYTPPCNDKSIGGLRLIITDRQERRIKMKGRVFFITILVMALALMVALPNTGQAGENEQLKKYYKDYISKCILKNQSKAGLQNSKSANLRSCGALSKQKVIFLTKLSKDTPL